MYKFSNYFSRGRTFLNNQVFPGNKKLSTLMIYATDLCDSACKHCLIWAKRPVNYLSFEKIKEIMASKCITKHTAVGLEGGEFMLHPDAEKIMEWFYHNHPQYDLLSNCLKPARLIEAVKKYPPKRLLISLDGTEATYLYMRGKPGYNSVLEVIEALYKVLPMSVMFTLSPYNDFDDMQHVAEICKKYGIDMRVGIYNDIAFFDTIDKAHETEIGSRKGEESLRFAEVNEWKQSAEFEKAKSHKKDEITGDLGVAKHNYMGDGDFTDKIPEIIKEFSENYDFLVLYNEWRKGNLKMRCYSILDSLVILPDGSVPICQNLDLKLGNVFEKSLDEIFNGTETQELHKEYVHNCNQCWLNFHRKYDVILYRTFEKYFGRFLTSKMFGYYQWESDARSTYESYFRNNGQ
ncbi:radical SAM protein [Paraflavitalea sp. CAU 1676]|uniref:radical SAM protein n=1 Tax=Paraflavitalea sp. CAU 1676 TaxID=3032598 RepID=UPI0023DB0E68|nr:radical SAM protein [Paraflavitalea sp. CAU 1676]MDF2189777.1 SPASM domain-containing protein [Paraflavitalea sp. CAU 1676]